MWSWRFLFLGSKHEIQPQQPLSTPFKPSNSTKTLVFARFSFILVICSLGWQRKMKFLNFPIKPLCLLDFLYFSDVLLGFAKKYAFSLSTSSEMTDEIKFNHQDMKRANLWHRLKNDKATKAQAQIDKQSLAPNVL